MLTVYEQVVHIFSSVLKREIFSQDLVPLSDLFFENICLDDLSK